MVYCLWIELNLPDTILEDAHELCLLSFQEGEAILQGHFALVEISAFFDVPLFGIASSNGLPDMSTATESLAARELVREVSDVGESGLFCTL